MLVGGAAVVAALLAVPGMVSAGSHSHDGDGHDDHAAVEDAAHADDAARADDEAHTETAGDDAHAAGDAHTDDEGAGHGASAAARPYDPALPIDLGGVEGVTPQQQAQAENLVAITLLRLPQFADPAVAEAAGFRSIGDALTGYEHFLNRQNIADDTILDPDRPESLVYRVENGVRTLEAAMYMLRPGDTLDTVPDIGGDLIQWHVHDNLCFTADAEAPQVRGLTRPDGSCAPPLVKGQQIPMVHVWTVPHECGPFAALEGVGAGQIKEGEERLCDHAHGGG
jgi:hypothetical protein